MKKFVGLVNGKSFDNEKDFNDAANEAIKLNDGNLAISSYYSYTNDDEVEEPKDDDRFLSTHEYFLGERKPDIVNGDCVEYTLSDELKKRITDASNINDIKKSVEYHISKLDNSIELTKGEVKKYQEQIEKLQDKLYERVDLLKDLNARNKYYETILDITEDSIKKEDDKKESEEVKPITRERIREVLGVSPDMSLYSFLKQLGLLK